MGSPILEPDMATALSRTRRKAFQRQNGRCWYCNSPIWENNPTDFAAQHTLTLAQARLLQSTAEHLHARCDGGGNQAANIVAACLLCNSTRHKAKRPLAPKAYQRKIEGRIRRGKWLPAILWP